MAVDYAFLQRLQSAGTNPAGADQQIAQIQSAVDPNKGMTASMRDQIDTLMALKSQWNNPTVPSTDKIQSTIDDLYGKEQSAAIGQIQSQYGGLRENLAENQAALGRFDSPVAAIPELSLSAQEGQDISNVIGGLSGQEAGASTDLYKYGLGLNYQNQSDLNNLALAQQLGGLQANALNQKPSTSPLQWASLGIQGLGALGSLGSGIAALSAA